MPPDRLGILLISAGHERAHYAFVIAAGAAAVGRQVVVFATNEGCRALQADLGAFAAADESVTARGVAGLSVLREAAADLGVRLIACEAGLRLAGLTAPLANGVEIAGIVTFLEAVQSGQVITL